MSFSGLPVVSQFPREAIQQHSCSLHVPLCSGAPGVCLERRLSAGRGTLRRHHTSHWYTLLAVAWTKQSLISSRIFAAVGPNLNAHMVPCFQYLEKNSTVAKITQTIVETTRLFQENARESTAELRLHTWLVPDWFGNTSCIYCHV